jgi:hypothetical protein
MRADASVTGVSAAPTVYFHEDQHFRGSWLWLGALIALPLVVLITSLAASPRESTAAVVSTLAVGALLAAIFGFARLETEVRSDGVYVHFHGLWRTRRIALEDIEGYQARRYSILESGGWGVHFTMGGMAYNVSGNTGVIIRLKTGTGGRVLIGTQKPDEFAGAIAKALEARRSR